jgi:hypothetical protein
VCVWVARARLLHPRDRRLRLALSPGCNDMMSVDAAAADFTVPLASAMSVLAFAGATVVGELIVQVYTALAAAALVSPLVALFTVVDTTSASAENEYPMSAAAASARSKSPLLWLYPFANAAWSHCHDECDCRMHSDVMRLHRLALARGGWISRHDAQLQLRAQLIANGRRAPLVGWLSRHLSLQELQLSRCHCLACPGRTSHLAAQ